MLIREGRSKQEREAERRVRRAGLEHRLEVRGGAAPPQLCSPAPGFTIYYEQPQAASGWSNAQRSTTQTAASSVGLYLTQNAIVPLLVSSLL